MVPCSSITLRCWHNLFRPNAPSCSVTTPADRCCCTPTPPKAARARIICSWTLRSLSWPDYHRFLKKKYPRLWESNPPKGIARHAEPLLLVQLVSRLAQTNSIYYLHPSFGYYFEFFYPEPHGLVYKLNPYPTNVLFAPLPNKDLIAENEAFWAKADATSAPTTSGGRRATESRQGARPDG